MLLLKYLHGFAGEEEKPLYNCQEIGLIVLQWFGVSASVPPKKTLGQLDGRIMWILLLDLQDLLKGC